MENSGLMLFIGGIVVTVFLVMGGVFNLRRQDIKTMQATDSVTATGNRVWSYLTPPQQEELNSINSLLVQEEWIEEHVDPSTLEGVSAERVLIELANRGFVTLGRGVFRRHASPLDFINPAAKELVESEQGKAESANSANDGSEEAPEDHATTTEKNTTILIVSAHDCGECEEMASKFERIQLEKMQAMGNKPDFE